jgi:hypothetical protein
VPRQVARLVTRLVTPLVVDYSTSRRLVVNYCASAARPGASTRRAARHAARRAARRRLLLLTQARHRLLHLHRAFGCLSTSRDSSCDSWSTTSPRAGSSSTTSPTSRVRVPRHIARLVTRLVVDYFASRRLAVDYFAYAARPGASAHHVARHAARRRLLRLRRASGCRGSSRGSSSTTLTTPRIRLLQHVARLVAMLVVDYFVSRRLVVDYFSYAARPGASACRAALLAARRRLLRLHRASGCLGASRGSSHGSSSTTPLAATSSCNHTGSTSAMPCVATTCLAETLALHQLRHTPSRRRLLVALRRPFILTSFPN